ncbi:hypothetical protein ACFXJ8_34495 [Nonomuraea sp. NPDC059194]|uniref:hypothetical protein n=1 Tax=Nonomuraea sp. NPDC059194 TaxID=3346764 RepID=UPI0036A3926F
MAALVERERIAIGSGEVGEGRVGVVACDAVHAAVAARLPGSDDLDARVVALMVTQSKGLEFDSVVVVDPAGNLAQSPGTCTSR